MRHAFLTIILLASAVVAMAQPNYKYILQHLPEYSDREALYRLQDYQLWFPKKPHAYFLMANIEYRLQKGEHAIIDHFEKDRMLYDAQVYYGNCGAFLKNDHIKADMYPDAAVGDKVSEEGVLRWLKEHREQAKAERDKLTTLYNAYCALALCYDSCSRTFSAFCGRYSREKDALMMADSIDEALLQTLSLESSRLPELIRAYQKALTAYPIAGYKPVFRFVPIEYYRLEGLTGADLLQNDVALWDYNRWVENFRLELTRVTRLKRDLLAEQNRVARGIYGVKGESKALLNGVRRYDAESPASDLLHLQYQLRGLKRLVERTRRDSVAEDDRLPVMQQAYKVQLLLSDIRALAALLPARWQGDAPQRKYRDFLAAYQPAAMVNATSTEAEAVWSGLEQWLGAQLPTDTIQISETLSATMATGHFQIVK